MRAPKAATGKYTKVGLNQGVKIKYNTPETGPRSNLNILNI
jgi:hypothetical protein